MSSTGLSAARAITRPPAAARPTPSGTSTARASTQRSSVRSVGRNGTPTCTTSTRRPSRRTGSVTTRTRRSCSTTVSNAGRPSITLCRAAGDSGSVSPRRRRERRRSVPSGSRSWKSWCSGSRNSRSHCSATSRRSPLREASRTTSATVSSERSTSWARLHASSEYDSPLMTMRMASRAPAYQSVSRVWIESGRRVTAPPSAARSRRRARCAAA